MGFLFLKKTTFKLLLIYALVIFNLVEFTAMIVILKMHMIKDFLIIIIIINSKTKISIKTEMVIYLKIMLDPSQDSNESDEQESVSINLLSF